MQHVDFAFMQQQERGTTKTFEQASKNLAQFTSIVTGFTASLSAANFLDFVGIQEVSIRFIKTSEAVL